ncbi:hypothetical protein Anas_11470, partial [Armadillidium nasatum]
MRVNLSVAIVAMVKESHEENFINETITLRSCPLPQTKDYNNISSNVDINIGEFTWDEKTQGLILGSFYYSYGLANVIGGPTADYFGGRMLIGVATLANAILTILTPMASRLGVGFLIAIRVLEGCFQGVIFPSMNKLITRWFTTEERSKFIGFIFAGMDFGCVLTFSISGYLCKSEFLGGWPSVFYIFAKNSCPMVIHPSFKILLGNCNCTYWTKFWLFYSDCQSFQLTLPIFFTFLLIINYMDVSVYRICIYWWCSISIHIPFINVSNYRIFIYFWCSISIHIPFINNGLLTAIPFLATWVFSVIYSIGVDKAITSGFLTILSVRRLSVVISGYGSMLCLIGMCFVNCSIGGAFAVLLLSGILAGASYCGIFSSYSDLSPKFAGTLIGLGTGFGGIAGFVGPAVTGMVTEGNQSIPAWRIVFIMCAIISGITATIYELFITTEIQPWNEPKR